MNVGVILWI